MSKLTRTAIAIEQELLRKFDDWMTRHGYDNRSEAVRDVVRATLIEEQWADPGSQVVATLSIIYDHSAHSLAQDLTQVQHEDHHAVLCSQHVHLDEQLCLEVILMKGTAGALRRLSDTIIASRGVKVGKLTLMSKNF